MSSPYSPSQADCRLSTPCESRMYTQDNPSTTESFAHGVAVTTCCGRDTTGACLAASCHAASTAFTSLGRKRPRRKCNGGGGSHPHEAQLNSKLMVAWLSSGQNPSNLLRAGCSCQKPREAAPVIIRDYAL